MSLHLRYIEHTGDAMSEHQSDTARHIDLWPLHPVVGIIVAHLSGVVYTNQTGGYATYHPSMEGVFVPLPRAGELQAALDEHFFDGAKWEGHCYSGIDAGTADFIDQLLSTLPPTRSVRVNRERLKESMEAWIHLTIVRPADDESPFSGFDGAAAVLTWENSD